MKKNIILPIIAIPLGLISAAETERPNILWLTYEDTSPQFIGCYGNEAAKTPTMDSLFVNGGIRFNYAYANSTVSSASRSCIITGRDVNIMGTGNHRYNRTVPAEIKGFPYYLRQAGYYTSNNVKTDYNISNPNFITDAWNESSSTAHWRNRPTPNTPFFSVFNIMFSHQSFASRNSVSYYLTGVYDNLNPARRTDPATMIVPPFYRNDAEMHGYMTRMQNCINYTDQIIEERIKELREDGLDQNTIIFIFSDHGEGIPRAKTCPIGMGYRTPFIVWLPEKWKHLNPYIEKVINDKQICFEDLAPTILNLVGVQTPLGMNGKPFMGNNSSTATYIHGSRNRIDDSPGIERSVMKGRYVYTRVFSPYLPMHKNQGYDYNGDILVSIRKNKKLGLLNAVQKEPFLPRTTEYLYDLETDQWEITNLAYMPEYASLLNELRTEMIRYTKEIKDIGFMPEYEMQKRSQVKTPYDLRADYDINSIVDAAMLVGGGPDMLLQQLNLLNSTDDLVRYWAAVGIYNQGSNAVSKVNEITTALNKETFEGTRIELAAYLYKFCNVTSVFNILAQYAKGSDPLLANDAVVKIQNMGDKIVDFSDLINEIQPLWSTNDNVYCVSPTVNVTQILINDAKNSSVSDTIQNNAVYNIKNALTGGYLGVKDASLLTKSLINQTLSTGKHTQWKLEKQTNGISLTNLNSGMALSMDVGNLSNGNSPIQEVFVDETRQLWNLELYDTGYKMINKFSNKMLQVNGQSKAEGAVVSQWDWNGKTHFIWKLERVPTDDTNLFFIKKTGGILKIQDVNPCPVNKGNSLNIEYVLNEAGEITISLVDLTGKNKTICKKEIQIPGDYRANINIENNLNSGIYLIEVKLNSNNTVSSDFRKFIVQ